MAINYAKTTWVNNQTRLNATNMNNLGNAVTDIIEVLEGKTSNGGLVANFESLRFTVMGDNSVTDNSGLYRRTTQLTQTLFGGGTTFAYNYGDISRLTFGKIISYGDDSLKAESLCTTLESLKPEGSNYYGLTHFLSDTSKSLIKVNELLNTHRQIYRDAAILYGNETGIQTVDEDKQIKIYGPVISLYSGNGSGAEEFAKFTSKGTTIDTSLTIVGPTTLSSAIISDFAEIRDTNGNAVQGTNDSSVVVYTTLQTEIQNRTQADNDLKKEIIGDSDDTVEDNTLNGVINYAKNEFEEVDSTFNLVADQDVIKEQPSVTLSVDKTEYEVGAVMTPTGTVTFNPGTYTYDSTGAKVDTNTQVSISNVEFVYDTYTTTQKDTEPVKLGDENNVATDGYSKQFRVNISYTDGADAYNNLGRISYNLDEYRKGNIVANKIVKSTKTSYKTINSYRQVFFGSTTDEFSLDSKTIRGLGKTSYTKSTVSSFTMAVVEGANEVLIAVPNNRKVTAVEDKNAFGTDIAVKFTTTEVTVAGADGDDQSAYATKYTVYMYRPDAALSSNTYTIRLGNA